MIARPIIKAELSPHSNALSPSCKDGQVEPQGASSEAARVSQLGGSGGRREA